jgi:poly(hydroxyalkanoate) depolymerase family esterase
VARTSGRSFWAKLIAGNTARIGASAVRAWSRAAVEGIKPALARQRPPAGRGEWLLGLAMGVSGTRRYRLFRPAGIGFGEKLPLIVMLHGCNQDANRFAACTRMNVVAARERFLVLYPEQDRLSNPQGCWNWYDSKSGRGHGEMALIMQAVDQVCVLYAGDRSRVAVAGLSAGASMAALLAIRYPDRFSAVVMHSGIPPGTAHSALSAVGAMRGRRVTKALQTTASSTTSTQPPLMVIHGQADAVVSAQNGRAAARVWAEAAGASAVAERERRRGSRYPMTVTDFKRQGRTMSTLVQVDRLGHAWSGGGANERFSDSQGPDASRMVWAFSARQFARREPSDVDRQEGADAVAFGPARDRTGR